MIRGITAIEGNTLTEEQVTTILIGKHVMGPQREMVKIVLAQEIKEIIDKGVLHAYTTVNAIAALT
jgi:hypothetical protein